MTVTQHQPSPDWNLVTLKWAATNLDGTPTTGTIDLTYNAPGPMLDDDPVTPISIYPVLLRAPIGTKSVPIWEGAVDANGQPIPGQGEYVARNVGYFEVKVPASNDPDIVGSGGSYSFTENLTGVTGRRNISFIADKDAPGGVIWLNRLPGVIPKPAEPYSVVYIADFDALAGRVALLEDETGAASWSSITDKPATFPPSVHDHDGRYYTEAEADGRFAPAGPYATTSDVAAASTTDRARSNHTGAQPSSTISDFTEAVQDVLGASLVGSGVAVTYDDAAGTVTLAAAGATDLEAVRDAIGVALVGVGNIGVAVDDAANTITISTTATQNATDASLRDRGTHTGNQSLDTTTDTSTRVAMTPAERTKLGGVATGATANATDAQLRDRSTHTGSQSASTISDFTEAAQDAVAALLVSGANVTLAYNDAGNSLQVTASGTDAEVVRDTIGAALVGTNGIGVTVNDAADTITITLTAVAISTVTGLQAALDDKQPFDSDLSALAGLPTQSYGRDFLTLADQAAARAKLGISGEALLTAVAPLLLETIGSDLRISAPLLKPTFGPIDQGFAGWCFDPAVCASAAGTGANNLILARVKAVESRTLANLWCYVGTAGASLTVAQMAIYDSTGNRLGITTDQSSAFTSIGNKKCALTAGVDVVAGQTYYLAILQVGTTPAAIARGFSGSAGGVGNVGLEAGPYRFNQLPGQSTVPASVNLGGLASNSLSWWMGMS
ncbi:hypothetical protein [Nocardioides marmoraquaticus]